MFCNTILLAGLVLSSQSMGDRPVPPTVERFFERPACSVGEIVNVEYRAQGIVAELAIDPRWAQALATKSGDLRSSWFGIHCPVYDPEVWDALRDSEDIFITAVLPEFGPYIFSCRKKQSVAAG